MRTHIQNAARLFALMVALSVMMGNAVADDDDDDDDGIGNIINKIFKRDNSTSFSGIWDTVAFNGGIRTLKLDQNGMEVTGKYSPGNGKVEGKIKDGVLRLQWKDEGGKGTANFVLSKDGQVFSGALDEFKDGNWQWWNGVRREKLDFGGTWNLASSDKGNYVFALDQKGEKVSGTFDPGKGVITNGKVRGDKLVFKYTRQYFDGNANGEGVFKISDDGQSLNGTMNEIEGPAKGEATCTATRAPVTFGGTWTWKAVEGGKDIYMEKVNFSVINPIKPGLDLGGPVIGNTIFVNWSATGLNHNAVLTMNPGGKSFRGILNFGGGDGARNVETVGVLVDTKPLGK